MNQCIDILMFTQEHIPRYAIEKCGYCRVSAEKGKCSPSHEIEEMDFAAERKTERSLREILEILRQRETLEISQLKSEIEFLKSQVSTTKSQCETQNNFLKETFLKLEIQRNKTFELIEEDLKKTVQFKMQEIDKLTEDVQKKSEEISEKNLKIKSLHEKIKVFEQCE